MTTEFTAEQKDNLKARFYDMKSEKEKLVIVTPFADVKVRLSDDGKMLDVVLLHKTEHPLSLDINAFDEKNKKKETPKHVEVTSDNFIKKDFISAKNTKINLTLKYQSAEKCDVKGFEALEKGANIQSEVFVYLEKGEIKTHELKEVESVKPKPKTYNAGNRYYVRGVGMTREGQSK